MRRGFPAGCFVRALSLPPNWAEPVASLAPRVGKVSRRYGSPGRGLGLYPFCVFRRAPLAPFYTRSPPWERLFPGPGLFPAFWPWGRDSFVELHSLAPSPGIFLKLARICVLARPGVATNAVLAQSRRLQLRLGSRLRIIADTAYSTSSTEIRCALAAGASCQGQLSPAVRNYINVHQLYRSRLPLEYCSADGRSKFRVLG